MNSGIAALSSSDINEVVAFNRSASHARAEFSDILELLARISRSFDTSVCSYTFHRPDMPGKTQFYGLDGNACEAYRREYITLNPFVEWRRSLDSRDAPIVVSPNLIDRPDYLSSRFCEEFHRPLGMHQAVAIVLRSSTRALGVVGLWRSDRQQSFGARERMKAELMAPALATTVQVLDVGGQLEVCRDLFGTLETLLGDQGIVLLDEQLSPVYANTIANELLTALRTSLDAPQSAVTNVLPALLQNALRSNLPRQRKTAPERRGCDGFRLDVPRTALQIECEVSALPRELAGCGYLLRLIRPRQPNSDPSRLRDVGLSPREIDVVIALTLGLSNAAIADRLCISIYTVQAHLKSMFRKLEVGSRTALLNRLNLMRH